MSQVQSVGQSIGTPDVRLSIARAAQATGVDFDYLLAQAKLESSLNPNARAGTSSAAGLYQFIGSTWLETLDRHGANHGFAWADSAISSGRRGASVADPTMRSQIMALRYDPDAASLMAAELARDNRESLRGTLGREPDSAELYLAHFMGSEGASRFLTMMQNSPHSSAAAIFPKQARANRPVFFDAGGGPRSLTQVMDHFRHRLGTAMAQENGGMPPDALLAMAARRSGNASVPDSNTINRPLGPLAQEFHGAASGHANGQSGGNRISMVETLRRTFADSGEGNNAALPDHVKSAYSKLKAFDL